MYRRYSPQGQNLSAQNGGGEGYPRPSAGAPKNYGQEPQHKSAQTAQNNYTGGSRQGLPPSGKQSAPRNNSGRGYSDAELNAGRQRGNLNFQPQQKRAPQSGHTHSYTSPPRGKNPLLGFLPPSLYNPQTKKILGFLEAEDLLLAALILILSDSNEGENSLLMYALLYVLLSDFGGNAGSNE